MALTLPGVPGQLVSAAKTAAPAVPFVVAGAGVAKASKESGAADNTLAGYAQALGFIKPEDAPDAGVIDVEQFKSYSKAASQYASDMSSATVRAIANGIGTVAPVPGGLLVSGAIQFLATPLIDGIANGAAGIDQNVDASMEYLANFQSGQQPIGAADVDAVLKGQFNKGVEYPQINVAIENFKKDQDQEKLLFHYDAMPTILNKAEALNQAIYENFHPVDYLPDPSDPEGKKRGGYRPLNEGVLPSQFIADVINKYNLPASILLIDDEHIADVVSQIVNRQPQLNQAVATANTQVDPMNLDENQMTKLGYNSSSVGTSGNLTAPQTPPRQPNLLNQIKSKIPFLN